jgi:7-carboxy-7-deazaguanine synthase
VPETVSADETLLIQEEFVSIQGEGELAGVPSRFIRTSGCNLRCAWCDSPATSWHPEGERISVAQLVERATSGPSHVVITGGEPMLLSAVGPLSAALIKAGLHVTIETAGTVDEPSVHASLWSISPKLAHSVPDDLRWAERHERLRWRPDVVRALMRRGGSWQLKFVVRAFDVEALARDVAEIETMLDTLEVSPRRRDRVFLMPECTDPGRLVDDYRRLTPTLAEHGFRLGPRLHLHLFGHTPGT